MEDKKNWQSIWNEELEDDKDFIPTGSNAMPIECSCCLKHRSDCQSLVSIGNLQKPLPYYICETCIALMYELVWR